MLGPPTRWDVVGEASDGLDAIQKAGELNPDLILLDIGLPGLDGIQTARRILADSPRSRILFVSEHQSLDVVQAALGTGVRGYIVKSDVARDLLIAMDAIVDGRRFISARFGGRVFDAEHDVAVTREMRRHEAGIYADERSLLDGHVRFAAAALAAGASLITLLPGSRRDGLHQGLLAGSIDVDGAMRDGRFIPLEIPPLLSRVMVDGRIDEARFWDTANAIMPAAARAARGMGRRIAMCAECAPTLMRQAMWDAAISLERLCDEMARAFDVDVFCGYLAEDLRCDDGNPVFEAMCAAHSLVHERAR